MEEDDKKEAAAKMINTTTTDHQKEEDDDILQKLPLDSSFCNKLQIKEEPSETESSSKKRKQVGGDVAMINSPTMPFPLDSSPSITTKKRKEGPSQTTFSETPTKRSPGRPHGSGSGSKMTKEGPSQTTSAETPTKRRPGRLHGSGSGSKKTKEGPSQTTSAETTSAETSFKGGLGRPHGTSGGKLTPYMIELKAGQDVVEVIYNICNSNRRKTMIILSASGSVIDIVNLTPAGPKHHKGVFEMHSMSIKCLLGDDGRRCREKAMCTVVCRDDNEKLFGKTAVNSLIVADCVKITAALFYTDIAKKTGERISKFATAAAAARNEKIVPIPAVPRQTIMANFDPDREMVIKEEGSTMLVEGQTSGFLPTTPSVADADMINPTTASTSTSNDQDMKSPSEGDT